MKRLFTIINLLLLVGFSVNATTLWEGTQIYSDYKTYPEEGKNIKLAAEDFASANIGDKLTVEFTEYTSDPQTWHQVQIFDADISNALSSYHILTGDTKYSFVIDATLLAQLKAGGCTLAGTGYTVTKITLDANDGKLWEGEAVIGNWNSATIAKEAFTGLNATDAIIFHFSEVKEGAGLVLRQNLPNGWASMPSGKDWMSIEGTELVYQLTAEDLESMQTYGLVVTGMNYTLSSITTEVSTGIKAMTTGSNKQAAVFSLNGIRVSGHFERTSLPKGVYIVDGKKIVIK